MFDVAKESRNGNCSINFKKHENEKQNGGFLPLQEVFLIFVAFKLLDLKISLTRSVEKSGNDQKQLV